MKQRNQIHLDIVDGCLVEVWSTRNRCANELTDEEIIRYLRQAKYEMTEGKQCAEKKGS